MHPVHNDQHLGLVDRVRASLESDCHATLPNWFGPHNRSLRCSSGIIRLVDYWSLYKTKGHRSQARRAHQLFRWNWRTSLLVKYFAKCYMSRAKYKQVTFIQALFKRNLVQLTVAIYFKVPVRFEPIVRKCLCTQATALFRLGLMTTVQLGRIHSDLIDLIRIVTIREKAWPQRVVCQWNATATFFQCINDLLHRSADLQNIHAGFTTNRRPWFTTAMDICV